MENVVKVERCWRVEFGTPLPTRVPIKRIRGKFEIDGTVQDVLKGRCGRKRSSTKEFPPRSPELTPLGPYLWGTLENTVYITKPQTLEELRGQIEHAINDIPLATVQTVCRSVRRRCWEFTAAEGGRFEYVRA